MKRLICAIGLALLCAIPAHAQDTAVIVKDPDPPTPAIRQTTTTTTIDEQDATISTATRARAPRLAHHTIHHHRVHHTAVAYHPPVTPPVTSQVSTATQTTTQTTVTVPPRTPTALVREHADGSVSVSTSAPAVEVPADQGDGQH